ncbi:MAG: RDD family protein [Pseudomonadota bacterium]
MHCPSCYKKIGDDDRNCPHCGTSLSLFNPPSSNPSTRAIQEGEAEYAGFWVRAAAHILDGFIIGFASLLVLVPLMFVIGWPQQAMAEPGRMGGADAVIQLISIGMAWLYYALLESSAGRSTFGKRLLGLQVSDMQGEQITFARATGRYFATLLCYITFLVGFIMAAFTARKQALHDMAVGTVVTYRPGASRKTGCVIALVAAFLIVTVIGVLAAIAVPVYQDYVKRAQAAQMEQEMPGIDMPEEDMVDPGQLAAFAAQAELAADAVEASYAANGEMPASVDALQVEFDGNEAAPVVAIGDGGVITAFSRDGTMQLTMMPQVAGDGTISWMCAGDGLGDEGFPARCQ